MQSSYIPVTGIPIPTDQNASKYFFVTFLRLLTRNLIPGLSLVLYLDNRRERIMELGRGRGISNLDKKARITRLAPLI